MPELNGDSAMTTTATILARALADACELFNHPDMPLGPLSVLAENIMIDIGLLIDEDEK